MLSDLRRGYQFARQNPLPVTWETFRSPKNKHPLVQFFKYFVCGGLATLAHNAMFALTGYTIFPHFTHLVEELNLTMGARITNFTLSSLAGFLVGNTFAYLTNLTFVFEGGRHSKIKEFTIFTLVSSIGFFAGLIVAILNLTKGTGGSWVAAIALVITSLIVNFICRKFFIFKG